MPTLSICKEQSALKKWIIRSFFRKKTFLACLEGCPWLEKLNKMENIPLKIIVEEGIDVSSKSTISHILSHAWIVQPANEFLSSYRQILLKKLPYLTATNRNPIPTRNHIVFHFITAKMHVIIGKKCECLLKSRIYEMHSGERLRPWKIR
jgi:hypothetical protein